MDNLIDQGLEFLPGVSTALRTYIALAAQMATHRIDNLSQWIIRHQGVDAGIVDDEIQFLTSEPKIQGYEYGPQ